TLELAADAFGRHLGADPSLAAAVASWNAHQYALALDHLAMLALRDPSRRVPETLLLLLERLDGATGSPAGARLDGSHQSIRGFPHLSRQPTNRPLCQLARAAA